MNLSEKRLSALGDTAYLILLWELHLRNFFLTITSGRKTIEYFSSDPLSRKMSCPFDKDFPSGCQTDKKIEVHIIILPRAKVVGETYCYQNIKFDIKLSSEQGIIVLLQTLAHELKHVQRFACSGITTEQEAEELENRGLYYGVQTGLISLETYKKVLKRERAMDAILKRLKARSSK